MDFELEELTHDNYEMVRRIDRDDMPENFVNTVDTIMALTDYGVEHGCVGHTFAVKANGEYIGLILLGEALHWETDPPQMSEEPFYRIMGFVIDKRFRGRGIGGRVLEQTVERVYRDFGPRPIALGCHKENRIAAAFYRKHGFRKTEYMETDDYYYLRYPSRGEAEPDTPAKAESEPDAPANVESGSGLAGSEL
jgi:ribosomal protein S18 acetylase RimI-like enzyme